VVFEGEALVVAAGLGDDGQRVGVDGRRAAEGARHHVGLQGVHAAAQVGG